MLGFATLKYSKINMNKIRQKGQIKLYLFGITEIIPKSETIWQVHENQSFSGFSIPKPVTGFSALRFLILPGRVSRLSGVSRWISRPQNRHLWFDLQNLHHARDGFHHHLPPC